MTEEGFVKAQSDNLPKVDSFMIAEFFAESDLFTSAEIRGIKANSAGRHNYGDAAVGYVQVKRANNTCTVKAKICPEHKVRNKNYNVSLVIDEADEKVANVLCHDCAASSGGCKHAIAIAFIMWVHRRSEEPAPTETECYWRKSRLSGVGTTTKYLVLEEFGRIKTPVMPNPSNGQFLNDFVKFGSERAISSQILKYYTPNDNSLGKLGMHQLLTSFFSEGGESHIDFFAFCKEIMTNSDCDEACKATLNQSYSKLWHELRYGRITASRLYEAARCKKSNGTLVEAVVGSLKINETEAMKRGKVLEKKVINVLERQLETKLHPVGLMLSPDHPCLGASPDAVSNNFVVKVKFPSTVKTVQNYVRDGKIANKFLAQINMQMYLLKKLKGVFCVADPSFEINNKISIYHVTFDADYLNSIIDYATTFWIENVFPILKKSLKSV